MSLSRDLLDEVSKHYDELDGKGSNPRPYDPEDGASRLRGKAFRERQEKRAQLDKERQAALAKYKGNKDV